MQRQKHGQGEDSCPTIILGSGETALGTMRSLRRSGIAVAYSSHETDIAAWSKPYLHLDNWPKQVLAPADLERWLNSTELQSAVLMPCTDAWVQSVSRLSGRVSQRFRRWTPSPDLVGTMVDKNRFRSVLETLELPHPESYNLERNIETWKIPDRVFESAFLKPHDSLTFFTEFGVKGFFVDSPDSAFRQSQKAWDKGIELMVQEYVPGPPSNHYFVDGYRTKDGSDTRFLARQRLHMFPPDFGNSSDMVSIPLASVEPAIETLNRLFGYTGFHGIFSAEFKLDQRDGLFKILEINCRPWWFVDFADRCGLHVCRDAYYDALDLNIPTQKPYKIGKRCIYPIYDWEAYRIDDKRGVASFFVMLFDWLRSYQPVFSWSDPMPAIVKFYRLFGGALARRLGHASKKTAT